MPIVGKSPVFIHGYCRFVHSVCQMNVCDTVVPLSCFLQEATVASLVDRDTVASAVSLCLYGRAPAQTAF